MKYESPTSNHLKVMAQVNVFRYESQRPRSLDQKFDMSGKASLYEM